MSKWREDRMFEIMSHLNADERLRSLYDMELMKSHAKYPRTEFFDRMEKCYEKSKQKLNNESL